MLLSNTRLAVKPSKFDHDEMIYTVVQRNITVATLLFEAGWQHWGLPLCSHGAGLTLTGGASAAGMGAAGTGPTGMGAAGTGAARGRLTVTGRPSQNSPRSGYCGLAWAGVSRAGGSSAAAANGDLAGNRSSRLRVRSAPAHQRTVWPHTRVCRGRDVRSRRAVQDAIGLGSCSCRGHGFSGKPGHQRVVGDRQLSGPSAFVSPLQLLGDVLVPWRVKPAGAADAVVPSRWVQPRTWLCAQAGGQLVAEVPGRTGGSGAKTRWNFGFHVA